MTEILQRTLRPARLRRGWSLDDLAQAAKGVVSKQMISKYEQGQATPSQDILFALATALGLKLADLLTEPKAKVDFVAFRKHSDLSENEQEKVKAKVCWQMEGRMALTAVLGEPTPVWAAPRMMARQVADAERHAVEIRAEWGLGRQPVGSLTSLLEERGAAVLVLKAHDKFHGISGWADGQAVVAVQQRDQDGARQRMDLAHELAHLILSPDSNVDDEEYAKTFAGAFLFPESAAVQELGAKRSRLTKAELLSIKTRYGISLQGILKRAKDLGILAAEGHAFWMMQLSRSGQRKDEGAPYVQVEQPTRVLQLASRALTGGYATLDQIRQWNLLPDELLAKLTEEATPEEDDHAAQRRFLAMTPAEREQASLEESRLMADFYASHPDELIPDFDDGDGN